MDSTFEEECITWILLFQSNSVNLTCFEKKVSADNTQINLFLSKFCIYLTLTLILIKVTVMKMTGNYLVGDGIFAISSNMQQLAEYGF